MNTLLSSAQMRQAEAVAIASGVVTGRELMERAGRGVVEAVLTHWPDFADAPGRVCILCGCGNNGGDGFVVARLLAGLGWQVRVALWGDIARISGDARANFDAWQNTGGRTEENLDPEQFIASLQNAPPDLIIDAVLGIGLSRDLRPDLRRVFQGIQARKNSPGRDFPMVAVDVPSGLCADSGRNRGNSCQYDLTVTFHTAKPGHYLDQGPNHCGTLTVVDIGLPATEVQVAGPDQLVLVNGAGQIDKRQGHKFDHGHAVVLAGGPGQGGAARMAGRAALRIGAGLVSLCCLSEAMTENAAQLNAIMLRSVRTGGDLSNWIAGDERINCLCIGPGLGTDARAAEMVRAVLDSGRAAVLDADALSLLAGDPALMARLHSRCILTPHAGEFARLFPDLARVLTDDSPTGALFSKVDVTRTAAARAGCCIVFKGADSVIADESGQAALHAAQYDRAAPWLATAGAGDVLAGIICGLVARGVSQWQAVQSATFLHVEAARAFGPGLIAEDIADALPAVLRGLYGKDHAA